MKIKEVLKPFVEETKEFIRDFGNKTHRPLEMMILVSLI